LLSTVLEQPQPPRDPTFDSSYSGLIPSVLASRFKFGDEESEALSAQGAASIQDGGQGDAVLAWTCGGVALLQGGVVPEA